jgi:hypothetical protein
MLLFFSHKLTPTQVEDAQKNWGVEQFIYLPQDLQNLFSNVPPELERLEEYAEPLKKFLTKEGKRDDIALIQGDFGLSCILVKTAREHGVIPVYATTTRQVVESESGGKPIKISRFEHIRFRRYE